jgi:hypothetical protein
LVVALRDLQEYESLEENTRLLIIRPFATVQIAPVFGIRSFWITSPKLAGLKNGRLCTELSAASYDYRRRQSGSREVHD